MEVECVAHGIDVGNVEFYTKNKVELQTNSKFACEDASTERLAEIIT